VVENALVLAATRRLIRRPDAPPLGVVRSLAYFLPAIEEVPELRVSPDYFQHLRQKTRPNLATPLASLPSMMKTTPHACGVDDIACPSPEQGFGVDNAGVTSLLFRIRFSEWVTSTERYRVILGEHRSRSEWTTEARRFNA